jgi:hypothetical protein
MCTATAEAGEKNPQLYVHADLQHTEQKNPKIEATDTQKLFYINVYLWFFRIGYLFHFFRL